MLVLFTAEEAGEVAKALEAAGYTVWWDAQLPAHRAYSEVIEKRLEEAEAVVVLWSKTAAQSQWVRAEADIARLVSELRTLEAEAKANDAASSGIVDSPQATPATDTSSSPVGRVTMPRRATAAGASGSRLTLPPKTMSPNLLPDHSRRPSGASRMMPPPVPSIEASKNSGRVSRSMRLTTTRRGSARSSATAGSNCLSSTDVMPRYTADIAKDISFDEFVWTCARAFGALVLLAQQLFDKPFDQVTQFSYSITGPWDNPRIERGEATPVVKTPG